MQRMAHRQILSCHGFSYLTGMVPKVSVTSTCMLLCLPLLQKKRHKEKKDKHHRSERDDEDGDRKHRSKTSKR